MKTLKAIHPVWYLIVVAALLRLINLGQESFWYDESFTAWLARLDFSHMFAAIRGDVHPPLWYLISWVMMRLFGGSEFAMRLPAALFGIADVVLVWAIANAVGFSKRDALIAGFIAAFLPATLYYSQEARMYALLSFCVLVVILSAIRQRWIAFTLACIAATYTQNLGVLYVAAIGIAVIIPRIKSPRIQLSPHIFIVDIGITGFGVNIPPIEIPQVIVPILSLAIVVLAWLPWAVFGMLHQMQLVNQGFWIQPLTVPGAIWPIAAMTFGYRLADGFQVNVYAAAIGWTLLSLICARHWIKNKSGLLVLAGLFGPPIIAALASVTWRSIYLPRAFLPGAFILCLLWAYPLTNLSPDNRRVARLIFIPVLLIAAVSYYFPVSAREPIRDYAQYIINDYRPGDVIFHPAVDSAILFGNYLQTEDYRLMPESNDLNQSLTDETKAAMQFKIGRFDDLLSQGYKRAWLIVSDNPMSSQIEMDEIARIEQTYCYKVIWQQFNQYYRQAIELVNLQCQKF